MNSTYVLLLDHMFLYIAMCEQGYIMLSSDSVL